jgi:prepilin-type N-terminal cleavage/methylation domain-containing protein
MCRRLLSARPRPLSLPPAKGRGEVGRRGFSLVELLVAVSIMLVLIGLMGAALSAARASQKKLATQALIGKLDAIITQQFESYATRATPGLTPEERSLELRRAVTGDMPDRWADVKHMANNSGQFTSPHQRAYIAVWNSMNPPPGQNAFDNHPNRDKFAGAECLFMIVMRGGIADCLDCSELAGAAIGDKDEDGAFEFWDAWGNPIGYILWPAALELPAGEGVRMFSSSPPFVAGGTGETMRPLIYSAGPDQLEEFPPRAPTDVPFGWFGFRCDFDQSNLAAAANCGVPGAAPANQFAKPLGGAADNITNLDDEAKQ